MVGNSVLVIDTWCCWVDKLLIIDDCRWWLQVFVVDVCMRRLQWWVRLTPSLREFLGIREFIVIGELENLLEYPTVNLETHQNHSNFLPVLDHRLHLHFCP